MRVSEADSLARQMKRESRRLIETDQSEPGSPMETKALEAWKRQRPALYQAMQERNALQAMAHVLVEKLLVAEHDLRAEGLPPSDARTQAYADTMMMEPDEADLKLLGEATTA